jgi:hypothetical protein
MKTGRHSRFHARTSRVFTLWMVLIMAMAMLPALPSAPVVEAGTEEPTATPTSTPEGTVGEAGGDEDPVEPTPTNTPGAEIEPDPGSVTVAKYWCEPGFDPAPDPDPTESCIGEPAETTYTLAYGQNQSSNMSLNQQYMAIWNDIPAGPLSLTEQPVPGYATAGVRCATDLIGTTPSNYQYVPVQNGSTIQYSLDPGYVLVCEWFNAAVQDVETSTYQLEKRLCPPGYDLSTATAAGANADCDEPFPGVQISLTTGNPDYPGQTQQTNAAGEASWDDIPYGMAYEVQENIPAGYGQPWIYCAFYFDPDRYDPVHFESDGLSDPGTTDPNSWPDMFSYDFGSVMDVGVAEPSRTEYRLIKCTWFNVPVDELGGQAEPGSGTQVAISKYLCPPGYNYENADAQAMSQECAVAHGDMLFYLLYGEAVYSAVTEQGGSALFSDIPYGEVTLTESSDTGYQTAKVFCYLYDEDEEFPGFGSYQHYPHSGPAAQIGPIDIPEGYNLECVWFNVAVEDGEADGTRVQIHKYVCDPEFNYFAANTQQLVEGCVDAQGNIAFSIPLNGNALDATTNINGLATFESVPINNLYIREAMIPGYQTARVVCHAFPYGTANFEWPLYEDVPIVVEGTDYYAISYFVEPGYELDCYWFNVPYDEENVGSITIQKYLCPPEYPDVSESLETWLATCVEPHLGASFYATYEGESTGLYQTTESGETVLPRLPGEGMLYEQYDPAYRPVNAYCEIRDPGQDPVGPVYDEATSGYLADTPEGQDYGIDAGGYPDPHAFYCYWFNVQLDDGEVDGDFGQVYAYKYLCPPGYDFDNAIREEIFADCSRTLEGVDYALNTFDGTYQSVESSGPDGMATFSNVPPGEVILGETPPDGYYIADVYCGVTPINNGGLPETWDQVVYDDGLPYELPPGSYLHCLFFNLPFAEEVGSVYAYKYVCPADYDVFNASHDELSADCTEPLEGVEYGVGAGETYAMSALTDQNGLAAWEDVPVGEIVMYEEFLPGYQFGRVYCGETFQNNLSLPEQWQEMAYQDGFFYVFPPDTYLHCEFYNLVDENYGYVEIQKYVCPPGFTFDAPPTRDDYAEACQEVAGGVQYELQRDGSLWGAQPTNQDGYLLFDTDTAGSYTITEVEGEAYRALALYCTGGQYGDEYTELGIIDGGSSAMDLAVAERISCEWYNEAQFGEVEVRVQKYLCPPGYDYENVEQEGLLADCTQPHEGVTFSVASGDGYASSQQTNATGQAVWYGVPPALISLAEAPVPGYELARVFCAYSPIGQAVLDDWQQYNAGEQVAYEIEAGYQLWCYWFNVQLEDEYGWIDLYKYVCPAGYDPAAASYEQYVADCAEPLADVEYAVYQEAGGYEMESATDSQGMTTWPGVPPGQTTIEESPYPGYMPIAVYCSQSVVGGQEGTYQQYDLAANGYAVSVGLQEGYYVSCYWFNAPEDGDYGWIDLYKYVCPPGYDYAAASRDELRAACTETLGEVTYGLSNPDGYQASATTDQSGQAGWQQVPAGLVTLAETPPAGYQPVRVYCGEVLANGDNALPQNWVDLSSGSTTSFDLRSGYHVYCEWYNVADEYQEDTVVVWKYQCPPGYAEIGGGYDDYAEYCQQLRSGQRYRLVQGENEVATFETSHEGVGSYTGAPSGETTISELPKEGYDQPRVFCRTYPAGEMAEASYQEYSVSSWGITYDFEGGYVLECKWYNQPRANEYDTAGEVVITKYLCEEGYDPSGKGRDDYAADCLQPQEGVTYALSTPGGTLPDQTTNANGQASWADVEPGAWTVTETPLTGYQTLAVYCESYPSTGTPPGSHLKVEAHGDSFGYYASPGYTLSCLWYNGYAPDAYGWVDVQKLVCPPGYDYAGASRDDLSANCTGLQSGVEYTLDGPDGYQTTGTTGEMGTLGWSDVPAGSLTLTESPPEGYQPARIYCGEVEGGPSGLPEQWTDYSNGASVSYELSAGYRLYCEWYNVADEEYGNLAVYKYSCPDGYDYASASRDDLSADCGSAQSGVQFDIASGSEYQSSGMTDTSGYYEWTDVPAGATLISETPPTGYQPVRVYCGEAAANSGTQPGSWQEYPVADGWEITYAVPAGYYVTCEWYNVPFEDEPWQLWIQKFNCEPGISANWTYHQFLAACATPGANLEYSVGYEQESASPYTTSDTGRVLVENSAPGTFVIQESIPSGYGGVRVYCQYAYGDTAGTYQKAQVYNGSITLDVDYGYVITCVWFNLPTSEAPAEPTPTSGSPYHPPVKPDIPGSPKGSSGPGSQPGTGTGPGPGTGTGTGTGPGTGTGTGPGTGQATGPATLVLTKFSCPEEYDVHGPDAAPGNDCGELTEGVEFTLSGEDVETQQSTTGSDGRVTFSELEAGPYLVQETLPENTQAAFIWTCQSDQREFGEEFPFTPFSYAGPDGRIGITLIPGETLECDWYNVPGSAPDSAEGAEVTVVKYLCPGASVIQSQCELYPDGATVAFGAVNGEGERVEVTTGSDGTASTAMPPGTYTIREIPISACLVDSDALDDDGFLIVSGDEAIEVRVYNCGLD